LFRDRLLLIQQANHRMHGMFVELRRMRPTQVADISGILDHRALHAEANPQKRDSLLAGIANRLDFAFDAALTETAWYQETIVARQQPFRPVGLNILATNAANANLRPMPHASMIEGFINRFIGVVVLGVLAHQSDADFVFRIPQPTQELAPIFEIG